MENGIDALKIAFGMIVFVLAISITISSFTSTIEAMNRIWEIRQSEESYVTDAAGNYLNYVNFSLDGGTRIVSAETIVPNMYRAYKENFAIYFYNADHTPMALYQKTNADGTNVDVNYIDLIQESFSSEEQAISHLDKLLSENNIYNTLKVNTFTEYLGEYYLEDVNGETDTPETNKNKKRVIAYVLN